jgi:hypothetical protein
VGVVTVVVVVVVAWRVLRLRMVETVSKYDV